MTRHPWIATFERAPEAAFYDLVKCYAKIGSLNQLGPVEAANVLFGPLPADDPARLYLGWAVLSWLNKRRQESPPTDYPRRQRWIREVCDAFDIVALLRLREPAIALRDDSATWDAWVADFALAPSRDAPAAYWSMLLRTQALTVEATKEKPIP